MYTLEGLTSLLLTATSLLLTGPLEEPLKPLKTFNFVEIL